MRLKTTLEQWATLQAVDRAGSIQSAANDLNKSHTTLIYAIRKLEERLGLTLVEVKGRRAVLTNEGKSILRRANSMLEQAQQLEVISQQLSKGVETEITIAIDHLCNRQWIFPSLREFYSQNGATSVQLIETSLSSTTETVLAKKADIAIINIPITNFPAEVFGTTIMVPVVASNHSLANKKTLCLSDLKTETQVVIRDLGEVSDEKSREVGWLKSQQRLTVDNFDHALQAVLDGVGFCRLPQHIVDTLDANKIVTLSLENANRYQVPTHITLPKGEESGPAARALYELLLSSANRRLGYSPTC
ncbi:LysR family transcriptional regulator [Vibrio sp. DW001]|uniref:LysR family transcriptional regulator n=1 Tax=Vibrio sp. DW001 TaxID=2912315 RepID=UPI0023AE9D6B|nr:LysR family transcriptional regulator [Vibrio sp. DW001]WED27582.1 LysR family transcriptional regulator [Vibrio sp. DW001]